MIVKPPDVAPARSRHTRSKALVEGWLLTGEVICSDWSPRRDFIASQAPRGLLKSSIIYLIIYKAITVLIGIIWCPNLFNSLPYVHIYQLLWSHCIVFSIFCLISIIRCRESGYFNGNRANVFFFFKAWNKIKFQRGISQLLQDMIVTLQSVWKSEV